MVCSVSRNSRVGRVEGVCGQFAARSVDPDAAVEGVDDPTVLQPIGGQGRDLAAGRSGHDRRVRDDVCRHLCGCGQEVFRRRNRSSAGRCSRASWQRPISASPRSTHRDHVQRPRRPDLALRRQRRDGGRWRPPTRTGSAPGSRRCSAPNPTLGCGRWPTRQPIPRRIGYSISGPEPGATPLPWHDAATRSTWWR